MGMKVSINLDGMEKKLSQANIKRGRYAFMNQAMSDMEQYVPRDQGDLRGDTAISKNNVYVDNGNETIHYTQPYARAQFYGMINGHPVTHYSQYGGQPVGRRWDLRAKSVFINDWIKAFTGSKGANL